MWGLRVWLCVCVCVCVQRGLMAVTQPEGQLGVLENNAEGEAA